MAIPRRNPLSATALLAAAAALSGCATRGDVAAATRHLEEETGRVEAVEASTAELDRRLEAEGRAIARNEEPLRTARTLAEEALERAEEARAQAAGSFLEETVYVVDEVGFPRSRSTLTGAMRGVLDQLTARLALGDAVYDLEVRGYGDAGGSPRAARRLGAARAEAARRYLHVEGGIPLHRIATLGLAATPSDDGGTDLAGRVLVLVRRAGSGKGERPPQSGTTPP